MPRKAEGYWERRQTALMLNIERKSNKTISKLVSSYNLAKDNIQWEIKNIFNKYASDGKLAIKDAKEMLNVKESKEFYEKLLNDIKSVKDKDIKRELLSKYNAPAYNYRIARYQALQDNINVELAKLMDNEKIITQNHYVNTIKDGYYHTIFNAQQYINVGFNFSELDQRTINLLLNEKWSNKGNFSARIYNNNQKLSNYLSRNMLPDFISGKAYNKIAQELDESINIGLYNATRLIRTEVNHFANEAEMLAYEELGIEKYRFVATLDKVTCVHCSALDNKVFYVKDRKPGKNYPPIHPNDRCTTVAEFDDEITEDLKRRARNEEGKSMLLPQDTNYNQWYNNLNYKDENIIEKLLNIKNKVQLKDITSQKNTIINKVFSNEEFKKIALKTNIKSIKVGGEKSYHKEGNIVLKQKYSNRTAVHEIGHAVDYNNKWLSTSKNFKNAIKKDKEYILKNMQKYEKIIKNNSTLRELSDIIGGMTNNKVVGLYKHKKSYWKLPNKVEKETFAQMFTTAANDDYEQLEIMKNYLPNTFKEFDNIIRRLL